MDSSRTKTIGRGGRQEQNVANLGYWPTDAQTMYHVSRMMKAEEGTKTALFDCSCGKLDALMPLHQHLTSLGVEASVFGIELHAERFKEARKQISENGIIGNVLHADALSDTSISESWAGVSIFNPPYADITKQTPNGDEVSVRLERLFWTQHIARTKKGTGITVAILPTQLFARDISLTRMMGRHFKGAKVYRAAVPDFNQVVIIGYRVDSKVDRDLVDQDLIDILIGLGENTVDVPSITSARDTFQVYSSLDPQTFTSFSLTDEMAEILLEEGAKAVESATQQISKHLERALARTESTPSIMPLRTGHVPAVLASGRLNGRVETEKGIFLFRGRAKKTIVSDERVETNDSGTKAKQVKEFIHKTVTAVNYIDITPGRPFTLTEVI